MAIRQSERLEILKEIEDLAGRLKQSRDPRHSYELAQKILAASMRLPVDEKKASRSEKS